MHMDLWFDLAVRGEPDPADDLLARFDLSDGAEPDSDERSGAEEAPAPEIF